jgi:hypothetical protein
VAPFDKAASLAFAEEEYADLLPAPTRHLMPIDRGLVCAWHDPATDYDGPQAFFVAMQRSPQLDYVFSPIGKLTDTASQETADRIFAGDVWRDDTTIGDSPEDDRKVADFLQAPVAIVKVLVYDGSGTLVEPEEVGPHKKPVDETEASLDALTPDAYRVEPPKKPAPPPPPPPGGDEGDADEEAAPETPGDDAEDPEDAEAPVDDGKAPDDS